MPTCTHTQTYVHTYTLKPPVPLSPGKLSQNSLLSVLNHLNFSQPVPFWKTTFWMGDSFPRPDNFYLCSTVWDVWLSWNTVSKTKNTKPGKIVGVREGEYFTFLPGSYKKKRRRHQAEERDLDKCHTEIPRGWAVVHEAPKVSWPGARLVSTSLMEDSLLTWWDFQW